MRLLPLLFFLALLTGCTAPGSHWYAPATWRSHAPADKADKARAAEGKALAAVDSEKDKVAHAAHVEFSKAQVAALSLPPSKSAELVNRFLPNGLGLLAQVDPLTAAESADLRAIVSGLLSQSAANVATAEKKQQAAECEAVRLSRELSAAQLAAVEAGLRADNAGAKLRAAFERENELANELRGQHARFWIAVALLVLVAGLGLYARFALGGVGAALHAAGAPAAVISGIDANLSKFGQWMIKTGRIDAAKLEAEKTA